MAEAASQVCTIKNLSRLKLRPWLLSKLNGNDGYIPGLEWVTKEQKTFKINWNHGGKSDWTKDKGQIFKEYAIQTGKHSEGVDKENFAKWKTNLRNALHKAEDIEQLSSPHHLSQHNPCRIYRFKTIQLHQQAKRPRYKPQSHLTTFKNEKSSGNSDPLPYAPLPLFVIPNHENSLEDNCMSIESVKLEPETNEPLGSLPDDLKNISPLGMNINQPAQNWNEDLGFQMNIELLYKNNKIGQWQIMDPSGCLLFYKKELYIPEPFKPDHYGADFDKRKCLEMPTWPDTIGNEIAKDKANAVLYNCDRGIILECIAGNISIIRNCKTSVYTSSTTVPKINRDEHHCKVKIFDFENDFLPKFEQFLKSESGFRPEADVIIYFGQDGNKLQTKETLVMAKVTSCQAQNMIQHEVEKRQCYSSIHVSNSDSHDCFVQQLNFSQLSIHNDTINA